VSCAPPLEETGYDWKDANATRDATKNSGYNLSLYVPSAVIAKTTYGTGAAINTIIEIDVDITFPDRADVLRSEITQAALSFITFHTYTDATTALTADELSAAIPFTFENRTGNVVSVKLTTSINTAAAYSDLLLRVDGKKYTYDHGLRLDIDENGKIEDIYDDQFIRTLTINGTGTKAGPYAGPAAIGKTGVYFSNLPSVSTETTAPANPAANQFFFTGNGTTTNSNILRVAAISNSISSTTSAELKAFFADVGSTLAKGIKLQKLNGTTWADAGSAEYDDAAPTPSSTSWYSYIVIKGVAFDHLATYRVIWTGSANTETTGTYYGVKVRLFIDDGDDRPLNRTQVVGGTITPVNSKLASFIPSGDFASYVITTANSYDSEDRNVVLKVQLPSSPELYWKTAALADFKKSFQVVYSLGGGSVYNGATDLVYIDVKAIEFKAEGAIAAPPSGTEKGKNVLYITLDPNFVFDANAEAAYQAWLTGTYNPWKTKSDAYKDYLDAVKDYTDNLKPQYDSDKAKWTTANTAYQTYITSSEYTQYETDWAAWKTANDSWVDGTSNPGDPGDPDLEPQPPEPVIQDPGQEPVEPPNPADDPVNDPGNAPQYTGPKVIDLYFRVNDGISVSDNAATNPTVFIFGSPDNFAYDFFEFYSVFE
jgi:hypothetical protein